MIPHGCVAYDGLVAGVYLDGYLMQSVEAVFRLTAYQLPMLAFAWGSVVAPRYPVASGTLMGSCLATHSI